MTASGGLAVVVVNYRTPALSIACLTALAEDATRFDPFRVVLVDGGSGDDSAAIMAAAVRDNGWEAWATVLPLPVNGGFGYANNQGMMWLRDHGGLPSRIVLINPDARPRAGALAAMAARLDSDPAIGAVGARLEHEDGRVQGSAFAWPTIASEISRGAHTDAVRKLLRLPPVAVESEAAVLVDWVTGAAVMFSRAALERVGLFDDGFFLYFEETELLHRMARAGYAIWHEPAARIVHHAGAATQLRDPKTGKLRAQPLPRYWYEARRRYFALTGGRAGTIAAGLGYLAGRALWQARCALTHKSDQEPPRTSRDFARLSLLPRARDLQPCRVTLNDAAGQTPGWMRQ